MFDRRRTIRSVGLPLLAAIISAGALTGCPRSRYETAGPLYMSPPPPVVVAPRPPPAHGHDRNHHSRDRRHDRYQSYSYGQGRDHR